MIINDLNIFRAGWGPPEADAELAVDADTVLPLPVALERFQPVTRWNPEILQPCGDLELAQLAAGDGFDVHEPPDASPAGQGLGIRTPEGYNDEG